MELVKRLWATVIHVVSFLILSPLKDQSLSQAPLLSGSSSSLHNAVEDYPVFKPPTGRKSDLDFKCVYEDMKGWSDCSTPDDRGCWLRHEDGREYNIDTNYEDEAPQGIVRTYELTVTESWWNADGQNFTDAKLFNNQYPGPWLQACWGDTIEVKVNNRLKFNGTSIHWHGIRQLNTMHMDGVNGITQCPIAPNETFTYRFKALQYGSSWYHSHYSIQYADGLQGPLTIHGPSPREARYDEAKLPLLMTDWGHNSGFAAIYPKTGLKNPSILFNGIGNVTRFDNSVKADLDVPPPYEVHFARKAGQKAKRYLLRLINTSFESAFVFSIDNHKLQVIGADFVPVHPYMNYSVLIGIGQRYHVVVEADPIANASQPLPDDGNFWMRTWTAERCGIASTTLGYERAGILRYDPHSRANPNTTAWNKVSLRCSEETYSSLKPILPWKVGPPVNSEHYAQTFDITLSRDQEARKKKYPLAAFSMAPPGSSNFVPLRINYSDPIMTHLDIKGSWPDRWMVIPENYSSTDWIWMALIGANSRTGAHPIHLHGHDFALLQQEENMNLTLDRINITLNNPPRRDVVLLPNNGFVIIAFKADNPGSWLMHCHIARHASEGLGLQVLERQADAAKMWPVDGDVIRETESVCDKWHEFRNDCRKWWLPDPKDPLSACKAINNPLPEEFVFQDDSGV